MAKSKQAEIPELDWFDGRVNALMAMHSDRQTLFNKIDESIHGEWNPPEQMKNLGWVFKQVELIFRQVMAAAMRILSDSKPRITLIPSDTSQKSLNLADEHEKALDWLLSAASRRREATVVEDTVESSVRYSEVAQELIFLPVQIQNVEAAGGNPNRFKAMQRRGPFAVVSHHPGSVFPRYSDMGPEEVGCEEIMDPHDVVDLYGDAADELREYMRTAQGLFSCTLRSYHSYDYRAVWVRIGSPTPVAAPTRSGDRRTLPLPASPSGKRIEIARERWDWPFLPWVARLGGSSMETRSDYKRRALLSDAVYGNQFDTLSRVKTLRFSEMVRYAGSEKQVFKSPNRLAPDTSTQSAAPRVHINEDEVLETLQPPMPDPGMGLLYQELRSDVQKSTLSEVLFGGNVPAGAAFATINLVTHSAMAVLKEPRRLAENSIADLLELMLLWAHYSKTDLVGYGRDDAGKRKSYLIKARDIDPANLYISVELTADVPTDRQARMLAATQGVQAGILSRLRAREEIGINDAKGEEELITKEQIAATLLAIDLQNEQYVGSLEAKDQVKSMVMQELMKDPQALMQLLQQAMAQNAPKGGAPQGAPGAGVAAGPAMQPQNGEGGSEGPPSSTGTGMSMPSDEMMGGAGGAGAMPTREQATGMTQGGEGVA